MTQPCISIIIPTWNRCGLVCECLASVRQQTFKDFEALVVDDASADGTAEFLAERFPGVRVVRLSKNQGFARAINAGIREARGAWLFLLNNDMTLAPDCLEKLVEGAQETGAAMVTPLVLMQNEPERIYGAGDAQQAGGRPEAIGHGVALADFKPPDRIFGVSAGCALYRREVFDAVGLFDERFGAYFEDSDVSFRARLAGFEAALIFEGRAWHRGSASLDGRHLWRARQCCRNHLALVLKNYPAALLLRCAAAILRERRHQYGRVFALARNQAGFLAAAWCVLTAWAGILGRLPGILGQRVGIQRRRAVSPQELAALLTPGRGHD